MRAKSKTISLKMRNNMGQLNIKLSEMQLFSQDNISCSLLKN